MNVKLTTFGDQIQGKELSVCEKVMKDTKFDNKRYAVKLPFKESIPFVSDNYDVILNRLNKFKNRLSKSTDILAKYDKVITNQLEHGVIVSMTRRSRSMKIPLCLSGMNL